MLERRTSPTGVVYYVSPLLSEIGVNHAFSTRIGGISRAPFDSLNLGNLRGDIQDDTLNIQRNYQRLTAAAGFDGQQIRRVRQVHGAQVVTVTRHDAPGDGPEADGLITEDETCIVSVRVADCVPILLSSANGQRVAAVHAGWRGVIAGVVPAAVTQLSHRSQDSLAPAAAPSPDLVAAIGPCIGMDAFEVGNEVLDLFAQRFGEDATLIRRNGSKGHVDLRRAVFLQLCHAALRPDHIDLTDRCTFRDADEFYSHRRDKGITGRMAALIAPRT